jgi:ribosome biogenesis GTPase
VEQRGDTGRRADKADLCDDVAAAVELVAGDAPGVDLLAVSAYTGEGRGRLDPARSVAWRTRRT